MKEVELGHPVLEIQTYRATTQEGGVGSFVG